MIDQKIDTNSSSSKLGIYLHIPYCSALCHYCDFAKTANHDSHLRQRYLNKLMVHAHAWQRLLSAAARAHGTKITSLFIGGGTPSLYAAEFEPLLAIFQPLFSSDVEITLEANPEDINRETLAVWRAAGINRLSIGVQTFAADGLHLLRRQHSAVKAEQALALAGAEFARVSADLIYGWPGQDLATLKKDIETALAQNIGHLSMYQLTYEAQTPMGRAKQRGALTASPDDMLADMFVMIQDKMAEEGFEAVEVSNWSRPGQYSRHNALYWTDASYIGIGAGAHGYLRPEVWPSLAPWGLRYAYHRDDRRFVKQDAAASSIEALAEAGLILESERGAKTWLYEYVGQSLRWRGGLDLGKVKMVTGYDFVPNPVVQTGIAQGLLRLVHGRLVLDPKEWIRESGWCGEVLASFASCP